jgi:hypothetical protein
MCVAGMFLLSRSLVAYMMTSCWLTAMNSFNSAKPQFYTFKETTKKHNKINESVKLGN